MRIDGIRKVTAILKVIAPEYKKMPEEDLRAWVELAEPYVSESRYGKLYYQALAYLTAHKMSLNAPVEEKEEESSISLSVKKTMNVASFSEGSTSVSFSSPASGAVSSGAVAEAEYQLTAYGLQFLAIQKQCIVPIVISGMKRV